MKKTSVVLALMMTLGVGSAMAEFKDFTVNGELVTKAQQEQLAAQAIASNPNPHAMINPQLEGQVKDMIVEYKVMARYAKQHKVDQKAEVKDEIANMTDMILMKHAVNDYLKANPVAEKDIKAEYDKEAARYGKEEVKVRHILVKTEAEAKAILDEVNKGASFAKLAAEKSLDDGSKSVGGVLDWSSPSFFTGELSRAIKALKKGEMAKAPVQSPAGWHVVKVEDVRAAQLFPKYEQRKEELRHILMQRKVQAFIHDQVLGADIKDVKAAK